MKYIKIIIVYFTAIAVFFAGMFSERAIIYNKIDSIAQQNVSAQTKQIKHTLDSLYIECDVNRACWTSLLNNCMKAGVIKLGVINSASGYTVTIQRNFNSVGKESNKSK